MEVLMNKIRLKTTISLFLFACLVISLACQSVYGETTLPSAAYSNRALVDMAYEVLELIKNQDYISLSQLIHPEKGVTFTPYSYVTGNNRFSADDLRQAAANNASHNWGEYDGSGNPIIMTFEEYFARFVYNENYIDAPVIGVNHIVNTGNAIENVMEFYPEAQFVEFHFPSIDPEFLGLDWCTLKLVFEQYDDSLKLVAIIHSEWTI
jgi:hypothetical protein